MAKIIPYYWLEVFCFICVLIQIKAEIPLKGEAENYFDESDYEDTVLDILDIDEPPKVEEPEPLLLPAKVRMKTKAEDWNFHVIALGHSGLLITWDADKVDDPISLLQYFEFTCQVIPEESHNITTISTKRSNITSRFIDVKAGQYQISALNESTHYRIYIKDTDIRGRVLEKYIIDGKTGVKTNSIPQKPKFKWVELPIKFPMVFFPTIWIIWLPCGNAKCSEFVTSTHFSIRYKILESKLWFESGDIYNGTYIVKGLNPGRIYEVTITSMNGLLKSDSYIEEIFFKPCSSRVRDVKIIKLSNITLRMTLKPPFSQLREIKWYTISWIQSNSPWKMVRSSDLNRNLNYELLKAENPNDYEQIQTFDFEPPTEYKSSIFIHPISITGSRLRHGLEYYVCDYDPKSGKITLP